MVPHKPGNAWLRLFKMTLPELPFTGLAATGAACAGAINPVFGLLLTTVREREGEESWVEGERAREREREGGKEESMQGSEGRRRACKGGRDGRKGEVMQGRELVKEDERGPLPVWALSVLLHPLSPASSLSRYS